MKIVSLCYIYMSNSNPSEVPRAQKRNGRKGKRRGNGGRNIMKKKLDGEWLIFTAAIFRGTH